MSHYDHGNDAAEILPEGTPVLLLVSLDPPPAPDDPVEAFVWIQRGCGHTTPVAPMEPQFPATLLHEAGFLSAGVCRGDGAGDEALYRAVIPAAWLGG